MGGGTDQTEPLSDEIIQLYVKGVAADNKRPLRAVEEELERRGIKVWDKVKKWR